MFIDKKNKTLIIVFVLWVMVFGIGLNCTKSEDITPLAAKEAGSYYTIGGTVSGLAASVSVDLVNNGADLITISANGVFSFPVKVKAGRTYTVLVATNPSGQECVVANKSGVAENSDISNVSVTCTDIYVPPIGTFSIGGTISGLGGGKTITLQNNGGDDLVVSANGVFSFTTQLNTNDFYQVTQLIPPVNQSCTIYNTVGVVFGANITDITISCIDAFTVGGTLSGLITGRSIQLQNNGTETITLLGNGSFSFLNGVQVSNPYYVIVFASPPGQTCNVTNGTGTMTSASVSNISIVCTANNYAITGTITGLQSTSQNFSLLNNATEILGILGNATSFTFNDFVPSGQSYTVTVNMQPTNPNQICTITSGSGTVIGNDITNVSISCVMRTQTVSFSVAGLVAGETLVMQNNGTDDMDITANGSYTFPTGVLDQTPYSVSVLVNPPGVKCDVTNGSGTLASADITNVTVNCNTTGLTWNLRTSGITDQLNGVYGIGGQRYVAVGNAGQIITSVDTVTWTSRTSGVSENLNAIWSTPTHYAVAGNSAGAFTDSIILTSTDGENWNSRISNTTDNLLGMFCNGADCLSTGLSGRVVKSTDGVTWTSDTIPSAGDLNSVVGNGTIYVSVGSAGDLYSSTDMIAWNTRNSQTSENLRSVAWSGTNFAAVGENGAVTTSANGTTWTLRSSGTAANLNFVFWSGRMFVAGGAGGILLTSPDGIVWTSRISGTANELYSGTTSNGPQVIVGAGGTVIASP